MRLDKIIYTVPPAIIWEKPAAYTNETALELLGTELQKTMQKSEADSFVNMMANLCKKLKIEARNLPINKEHPGNLNAKESSLIFEAVIDAVTFNKVV